MALCKPTPPDPELQRLIRESIARVNAMTPEERMLMIAEQRKSFVRGQIGMGSDADEAAYAAALEAGDTETLARLDAESQARMENVDRLFGG